MYGDGMYVNSSPLPSWAKDFSHTLDRFDQTIEEARERNREGYNASADRPPSVAFHGETVLSLNCVHVGEVARTTDAACHRIDPESVRLFLSTKCAPVIGYHARKAGRYPACPDAAARGPNGSIDNREAFWRTVFGNRCVSEASDGSKRHPTQQDMENLKTFVFFPHDDLPGSIRDQLLSDMGCHIFNRRFFITRDNLVGFGPSNMEPGDDVWIPGGSKVPFVFRPLDGPGPEEMGYSVSDSGLHPARRWRTVVGDCYVHGVMEGETAGMPEFVLFLK